MGGAHTNASLAAALSSMLGTAAGSAASTAGSLAQPTKPGSTSLESKNRPLPARPSLELVPPHDDSQGLPPDSPGTLSRDSQFARNMRQVCIKGLEAAEMQITNGRSTRLRAIAMRVSTSLLLEMVELDKWAATQQLRVTENDTTP